jgi:hypothetical protein
MDYMSFMVNFRKHNEEEMKVKSDENLKKIQAEKDAKEAEEARKKVKKHAKVASPLEGNDKDGG